jgi:predicted chitinase
MLYEDPQRGLTVASSIRFIPPSKGISLKGHDIMTARLLRWPLLDRYQGGAKRAGGRRAARVALPLVRELEARCLLSSLVIVPDSAMGGSSYNYTGTYTYFNGSVIPLSGSNSAKLGVGAGFEGGSIGAGGGLDQGDGSYSINGNVELYVDPAPNGPGSFDGHAVSHSEVKLQIVAGAGEKIGDPVFIHVDTTKDMVGGGVATSTFSSPLIMNDHLSLRIGDTFMASVDCKADLKATDDIGTTSTPNRAAASINVKFTLAPAVLPDIQATSLTRSLDGGADFSYAVAGAGLTQSTTVGLYWATGTTINTLIPGQPIFSQPVEMAPGSYGVFHVPASAFRSPPTGATHVLLVADLPSADHPLGLITETDETNNVLSIDAVPRVTSAQILSIVPAPIVPNEPVPPTGHVTRAQKSKYMNQLKKYQKAEAQFEAYDLISKILVDYLNSKEATETYQINTPKRRAAFIGQVAVETTHLTKLTEDPSSYASSRSRYKGRGLIQLTGLANYRAAGRALGLDLVTNPDQVASDHSVAARTAGWFWNANHLNTFADESDIEQITIDVNGPRELGYNERRDTTQRALNVLNMG